MSETISIIIANYNNAQYLPQCLDSILSQSNKNFEIVIVDDCSKDNSKHIITEYHKKYPNVFSPVFLNKNNGVATTRHIGILNSKGYYITTIDSDDYYADNRKLESEMNLIKHLKKEKNIDVISYSNIVIEKMDGEKVLLGNKQNIVQGNILHDVLSRNCMIPRDFMMLKSMYFAVGGFDLKLPIYEDWDLKIRLAAKFRFYYSGIYGTIYRQHGSGLSSSAERLHIKYMKKIYKKNKTLVVDANTALKIEGELNRVFESLRKRSLLKINKLLNDAWMKRQYRPVLSLLIERLKLTGMGGGTLCM